jgi:homoserine dehydrogenase
VIKLLAVGIAREDGRVELRVHPVMIPERHPLASVNDSFNAVFVEGDFVGETMFYGRGAGEKPTASAVVGDLIDLALRYEQGATRTAQGAAPVGRVVPMGEIVSHYFVRLKVRDETGVMAAICKVCADHKVGLKTVQQKDASGTEAGLVIITHPVQEAAMQAAIKSIEGLPQVLSVSSLIRAGL